MTEFEIATLAATVLTGFGQIGIVWYGIHAMTRATERRAADARDGARRASQATDQRHAEVMQALDIQRQAFREQGDALREQTSALAALVARTAPAADRTVVPATGAVQNRRTSPTSKLWLP